MIDCEKCREMISCLLDGELSQAEQSLVREHIASCPECRSVYDAFRQCRSRCMRKSRCPTDCMKRLCPA